MTSAVVFFFSFKRCAPHFILYFHLQVVEGVGDQHKFNSIARCYGSTWPLKKRKKKKSPIAKTKETKEI